jgi:hypothetical protein
MCEKLSSQKSSTSSPATVPENILLLFDGAQLMREIIRSPATAPENMLDAWLMTSPLGTPRGRCDEYSSKIFPQLRN